MPNLVVNSCNEEDTYEISTCSKKWVKPFEYLCVDGEQHSGPQMKHFLHRFDFGAWIYTRKNVIKLG